MLPHQVALVSDTPVINFSNVSRMSAALQKQATRDLAPVWGVSATVDAFERLEDVPIGYWPIIILDDIQAPGAAGYHTDDNGQPFALVQASTGWPLTASHECLEMLVDPFGNRTVAGGPPPQATGAAAQLERVTYLAPECQSVAVIESGDARLANLAWDLGAAYVLLPAQLPQQLADLVTALLAGG